MIGSTWSSGSWNSSSWATGSWADLSGSLSPTRGLISFVVLEVPNKLTRGLISFASFEVPQLLTRGRISFADFEVPNLLTRGRIAFTEVQFPSLGDIVNPAWNGLSAFNTVSLGQTNMRTIQGGNISLASLLRGNKLDASANAAAVVTITGVSGRTTLLNRVTWSYDGVPTGKLTITGGAQTFEVDITAAGPGALDIDYVGVKGADVVVTLAAGGSGVKGKVNVSYSSEV